MADRIRRLQKDERRLPKVPQTMDGPRRISQGTIGVRKLSDSRQSSLTDLNAAANPFLDLVPSGAQVKVLTSTNHATGRVQHLRRKSKTPIRHLQHVVPLVPTGAALKPRKMSMGKVVSHKQHARDPKRTSQDAVANHRPSVENIQEEEHVAVAPRKSISIGATQVKLVPNIQPKKSPRMSSAASEASGTSYQSGRSNRSHRSSVSRRSRASEVVTLTKEELSEHHLVQPRKLRQSFELRQQGLSAPVVDSAPPRPKQAIAPRAAPALRPATTLAASTAESQRSNQLTASQRALAPPLQRTPSGLSSAPILTAAPAAATAQAAAKISQANYQPSRTAPAPPSPELPPVVAPPELAPMTWTSGMRQPSISLPMDQPMPPAYSSAPTTTTPAPVQTADKSASPSRPAPIVVPRHSLTTPPRLGGMRIQQSPLFSPKGTRMEPRLAGYMPRRPSGPIAPVRMLRQDSRASLSDGFVQEDDEQTKTNIANSKIELYLASLKDRKPSVNQLENLPTANDVIAHHKRQLSFKMSEQDSRHAWTTDDGGESDGSSIPQQQPPRKSSRRPSVSSHTTLTSTTKSMDAEKSYKPERGTVPSGMDADEVFRGVKVGWLVATYNDYLAHVEKREAKRAAKQAKQKTASAPARSPQLPELDLSSPVASPIVKQHPVPVAQPSAPPAQLKSILKVTEPQAEAAPAVASGPAAIAQVVEERAKAVAADKVAAQAKYRASLARQMSSEIVPYRAITSPVLRSPTLASPKPAVSESEGEVQPVQRLWSTTTQQQPVQAEIKKLPKSVQLAKSESEPARGVSISGPRDTNPPAMSKVVSADADRVKLYSNEMTFYDPFAKHKKQPSNLRRSMKSNESPVASSAASMASLESPALDVPSVVVKAPSPEISQPVAPTLPTSASVPLLTALQRPAAQKLAPIPTSASYQDLSVVQHNKSYDLVSGPKSPAAMMKRGSYRTNSALSSTSDGSLDEFITGMPRGKSSKFGAVSNKAQKILGLRNKSPREVKFKAGVMDEKRNSKQRISVHDISGPLELQQEMKAQSSQGSQHSRSSQEVHLIEVPRPAELPVALTPEQISLAQFMREGDKREAQHSPLWQRDSISAASRPLVSPFKGDAGTRSSQESEPGTAVIPIGMEAKRRASSIYSPAQTLFNMDQVKPTFVQLQTPEMNDSPMSEIFRDYTLSPEPSPAMQQSQPPVQRQAQQQKHRFKPVHQLETIAQSPQTNKSSPDTNSPASGGSRSQTRSNLAKSSTPPSSAPPAGLGISGSSNISPMQVRPNLAQRNTHSKESRNGSPDILPTNLAESLARRKQQQFEPLDRAQTTSPFSNPAARLASPNSSREPTPDPFRNLKLPAKSSPQTVMFGFEDQSPPQDGMPRKNVPEPLKLGTPSFISQDSTSPGSAVQFRSPFEERRPQSATMPTHGVAMPSPIRSRPSFTSKHSSNSPDYVATEPQYHQPSQQGSQQPRIMTMTQSDAARHLNAEERSRRNISSSSSESAAPARVDYQLPQQPTNKHGQNGSFDFMSALDRSGSEASQETARPAAQKVVGEVTESLNYYAGTATAAFSKWFG
ncbi:hypothetical protein BCR37DRAFT_166075 [Protomyces lactucae-debilis]|uniref:Uncharacterized protein n=1 Tax=Protomyces lactucae-debilis TaxID=2754530 RepID=A0A1Y2EY23_PROLT|nr:uncharacterized protein BCR37DRAFT_166075 [Protomyces lactucae-debilis]ORY76387.1 hypothetical protein BCR37DRAFT_166075 [Protomyces lactucae-debilis]